MPFALHNLEQARAKVGVPIPVFPVVTAASWRYYALNADISRLLRLWWGWTAVLISLINWVREWMTSRLPESTALRDSLAPLPTDGTFGGLVLLLIIAARLQKDFIWKFFWKLYFSADFDGWFHDDYTEAWKQMLCVSPTGSHCSLLVFVNNTDRMEIPCVWDVDDRQLLEHISMFYYLRKAEKGLMEVFSLKSLQNIEVVQLERNNALGAHQYFLSLGRYKSSSQLTYYFRHPASLQGNELVEKFKADRVLAEVDQQTMALNFVTTFDSRLASATVLLPLLASLLFAVIWSVIAVRFYGEGVQASVQTGFTVGGYIVTTGALVIALIAFLDTRYTTPKSGSS